jgi:hypothetical protein
VLESGSHAGASIDPELLLRTLLIGYCTAITSERREATGSSAVFAMLGICHPVRLDHSVPFAYWLVPSFCDGLGGCRFALSGSLPHAGVTGVIRFSGENQPIPQGLGKRMKRAGDAGA